MTVRNAVSGALAGTGDPLRAPLLGGLAAVVLGAVLLGGATVRPRLRD